jgi:uncharacterized surface protein with fasciclin (FAS1) repeats
MRTNTLVLAASALATATAQAPDLATAIKTQDNLSTLLGLLGQVSNTTAFLASQPNVTLFAPSDEAFASIVSEGGIFSIEQAAIDPGLIEQILRYHLYKGVIKAEDIGEIPQFVPGYLNYSGFVLDGEVSGSNVTGGQVVSVSLDEEENAVVTAGIKATSKVIKAVSPLLTFAILSNQEFFDWHETKTQDIEFDNGIIHIIDKLLLIPLSISATLIAGNFTALAGAATSANLVEPLESLSDVTIFCPNNDAFQKLAGTPGANNITDEQLAEILQYHVVQGAVGYSTTLSNDLKLPTLAGEELTITIDDEGGVFVNNARVINSDILIANGVLHVIDTVLNPAEADAAPSTGEEPSATLGSVVPFTSGIEPETSVYSELTQTTSFVAAGLVTATPSSSSTSAAGNGSAASTTSDGPVQQTGNAGVRRELPALVGAFVGAVAFAANM